MGATEKRKSSRLVKYFLWHIGDGSVFLGDEMKSFISKVALCAFVPVLVLSGFALTNTGIPFVTQVVKGVISATGWIIKNLVFFTIYACLFTAPFWVGAFVFKAKRELFGKSSQDWICGVMAGLSMLLLAFKTNFEIERTLLILFMSIPVVLYVTGYFTCSSDNHINESEKDEQIQEDPLVIAAKFLPVVLGFMAISLATIILFTPYSESGTRYAEMSNRKLMPLVRYGVQGAEQEFQLRINEKMKDDYSNKKLSFILGATPNMDEDPRKGYLRITRPNRHTPIITCDDGKNTTKGDRITNELTRRFCEKNAGSY